MTPLTKLKAGAPRISDHALLRFLERAGGLDVEDLRTRLAGSFVRAHLAAEQVGAGHYLIKADGLVYVVRGDVVVTCHNVTTPAACAGALAHGGGAAE